jgi:arylsulfatase A-like enzyme
MRRRQFMGMLAGSLALTTARTQKADAASRRVPNVVYCFSDEHRWQSMSFAEMPELKTPHMARLASDGINFTRCISNYPVCSPHRAILMTGRWPYHQGVIDNNIPLNPKDMTIGKAFQAAGYHTAYIGKWHLGGLRAEPFGFNRSLIWSRTGSHYDKSQYHPAKAKPVKPKGYNATLMTDQALEYMEDRASQDTPFFLMVSWNPPHARFTDAPPEKQALYPDGSLPYRPNVDLKAGKTGDDRPEIAKRNDWPNYRGYHAHVSAIDDELGRVMAKLDELGISDNTILIYSSDHGSMFGSHGTGSKRQPYEESIRVPFLARWPRGIPKGQTTDALLGTIDLVPTLCSLAGVPVPANCDGNDYSAIFREGKGNGPDAQFIMHISKKNASGGDKHPAPIFRGIRTERHTYAIRPDGTGFLFDNESDPYQQDNLFGTPKAKDLQKRLAKRTQRFLEKGGDPFVLS